jgi:hypothetical protein
MRSNNDFVKALGSAVPLDPDVRAATDKSRFRYCGAIGKLIWPMVMTRPEVAFPVVKLSQFSVAPAMIHYESVLAIFRYLSATKHQGGTYTQGTPVDSLPSTLPANRSAFPSDGANDQDITALYDVLFG